MVLRRRCEWRQLMHLRGSPTQTYAGDPGWFQRSPQIAGRDQPKRVGRKAVRRTFRSRVGRVGYAASRATHFVPAHPRMIMPHALRGLACRILLLTCVAYATASAQETPFTHADTLRGSITPERAWWDVVFYDLHVRLDPADSTIRGWNGITYRVTGPSRAMQIDLQTPLDIDSVVQDGRRLSYRRDGNAFFVSLTAKQPRGATRTVTVYYH